MIKMYIVQHQHHKNKLFITVLYNLYDNDAEECINI